VEGIVRRAGVPGSDKVTQSVLGRRVDEQADRDQAIGELTRANQIPRLTRLMAEAALVWSGLQPSGSVARFRAGGDGRATTKDGSKKSTRDCSRAIADHRSGDPAGTCDPCAGRAVTPPRTGVDRGTRMPSRPVPSPAVEPAYLARSQGLDRLRRRRAPGHAHDPRAQQTACCPIQCNLSGVSSDAGCTTDRSPVLTPPQLCLPQRSAAAHRGHFCSNRGTWFSSPPTCTPLRPARIRTGGAWWRSCADPAACV